METDAQETAKSSPISPARPTYYSALAMNVATLSETKLLARHVMTGAEMTILDVLLTVNPCFQAMSAERQILETS